MKNWTRIFLVCFVLVGGTAFFAYKSLNQFNQAFNVLDDSVTSMLTASLTFKKDTDLASTSPKISGELATSTDETIPVITSTTTTAITTPVTATSANLELSFTFPQKGDEVYISCTYPISWQSSIKIDSLGMALVDAGTGEAAGPIASGLAKENTIEKDLQNLNWKVGVVWPGEYFISISNVNGVAADERSQKFIINKIPNGSDKKEQKDLCEKTGGNV